MAAPLSSLHVLAPYRLETSALPGVPYAAWVLLSEKVPPQTQWEISLALVRSGCRYAVASGPDCSTWDDSIDYAAIELLPEHEHIMTTWHDQDTLEEVADFFTRHTRTDEFTPQAYFILGIGRDAPVQSALALVGAQLGSGAT